MITHYKMDYLSNKQSYTLMELINNHFNIDKTDGTCDNFAQDIGRIATVLPRLGSEIGVVVFRK